MTLETVSRTLRKFVASSLTSVHGKQIELIDLDGLPALPIAMSAHAAPPAWRGMAMLLVGIAFGLIART